MDLFDENVLKENTKKKNKGANILLIIIILLVILCGIIIGLIVLLKNSVITVTLDNKESEALKNIIVFDDENNNLYVPIREFAEILGYESYNGEYLKASEDSSKCYVISENEVVNIALNSNQITKKELKNNSEYEKVQIEEPIKEIDGKLYANIDGLKKIFNLEFSYDKENKNITVYTLPYLTEYYVSALSKFGYAELKEGFSNEKAILNNILIAKNENNKYGVVEISTGKTILEAKYDDIEFLKQKNEFLVTSNGKKGVIGYNKESIINIEYDELKEINEDLYIVTKNSNVGIIKKTGENVIYPKYDYIGLEKNEFIKSQNQGDYIILGDLIPVKDDDKWAMFKLDGTQITDFIYDSFGSVISNDKEKQSVIFIEGYNVFIGNKENKYYLVTKERKKCNRFWL